MAAVASVAVEQARTSEARRINGFFKPNISKTAASTAPRVNAAYAARNPAAVAARWGTDGAGSTVAKGASSSAAAATTTGMDGKSVNAAYLARNPAAVAARWGSEETQKVGASAEGEAGTVPSSSETLAQMAALEEQNRQLERKLAQYEVNVVPS